jgi:FixJ family two-component response regulator
MTAVVFVEDDDVSVRESLAALLTSVGYAARAFASAHEFLAYGPESSPGCLVLDLELPDLHGLELQARLTADGRYLPIVFISGHADVPKTVRAMKAGASEFLTKPFRDDVLLEAIERAVALSRTELTRRAELDALRQRHESLTPREREVMTWVVAGLSNKQVGLQLGMQEVTVKAHRGRVMHKMRAESLADLVRQAARLELQIPARS